MKAIGGILGGAALLNLLGALGAAMFPDNTPNWKILLGASVACGVLSVITFSQAKK